MGHHSNVYYEVLDIPKNATPLEIRQAYRALCKKWHPDKHPPASRPEAEARFKAIAEAYETLSTEVNSGFGISLTATRTQYRNEEVKPPPRFKNLYYSNGSNDLSRSLLSSAKGKPPPAERKLECTLEELCLGCKKEITFSRDVLTKNGSIIRKQETLSIKVRPGWKKGTKITFEGMGDERPGCIPADVVLLISEKEHPTYKRVGNDLVLKVEVPLSNALTGWSFGFRLLTGERMSYKFIDEIIHPGYEKVIEGHGMPIAHDKGKRGDLRIKFQIVFPKHLSDEKRAEIREVLKGCS